MVKEVKIDDLTVHPALEGLPMLTKEQFECLAESIRRNGVLKPVEVDSAGRVVDGRNRLLAAEAVGLETVPCELRAEFDEAEDAQVALYALDIALTGRNLSKTAITLMLLDCHPSLAEQRGERKGGRPLSKTVDSVNSYDPFHKTVDSVNSFRGIAEKYGIPFEYFSRILRARKVCRNESDRKVLRYFVYEKEVSATNLEKAIQGWVLSHPITQVVDEDGIKEVEVPKRAPVKPSVQILKGVKSMIKYLPEWDKIDPVEKGVLVDRISELLDVLPVDVRRKLNAKR
jgi:hypothetical protein